MSETSARLRYALVLRVPRETEVQIEDALLGHLGVTRSAMGYHVTMLGPFCVAQDHIAALKGCVEQICHAASTFALVLAGIGAFSSGDNRLAYLQVKPTDFLLRLRTQFLEGFAAQGIMIEPCPQRAPADYIPHVTLALELTEHELSLLTDSSSAHDFSVAFVADSVALVVEEVGAPWRIMQEFSLGQTSGDSRM